MAGISGVLYWAAILSASGYLVMTTHPQGMLRSLLKILPTAFFAIAAYLGQASPYLTVALVLSLLGDLALSREGRAAFLYGLCAFALAHVVFIQLFFDLGATFAWDAVVRAPVLAIAIVVLAGSTEIWLTPFTGVMRWPVRVYVGLIAMMALTALTLPQTSAWITAGAFCFMASDGLLSLVLFRIPKGDTAYVLAARALWILYIAALALIFWGSQMV